MIDSSIKDLFVELTNILSDENCNKGKVYWWILFDARVVYSKNHKIMNIKLPLPVIRGNIKKNDEWKYKEHNEAEIKRVRNIWSGLIEQMLKKYRR